jgi:hypothetical protein
VESPKFDGDYAERSVDCRIALRTALKEWRERSGLPLAAMADDGSALRRSAMSAGWSPAEIKLALAQLAWDRRLRVVK